MPVTSLHTRQFTIRQVMAAIAVCAIALAWPKLFLFVPALVFWWIVILGAIYNRTGRRIAELFLLAVLALAVCVMFI